MYSPNTIISPFYPAPESNQVSVVALNPTSHFFFPHNLPPHHYYFSEPPSIYFFSNSCLPPPPSPSIWVYYPLWFINPNPNHRHESIQGLLPPPYTPNPSQELSPPPTSSRRVSNRRGYRRGKKVTRRRRIRHQVESNDDHITTVMLRNIPNRYTREMLIEFIDEQCEQANKNQKDELCPISAYDFVYLPIDFRTKLNKGYAFVNFTNAKAVSTLKNACNHMPWSCFCSRKVLEITSARIQGKDELVKHFQHMNYPAEAYSADGKEKTQTPNQIQVKL
ncbi:terminal ear1-like protein [Cardamine amara subsp. amara]|uniref:Terminal ear1-like protein n=1 Tax=Cardamine amara subsp. amara TaxID=228776 RepID=A0ABD0ZQ68_CARAN